MHSMLFAFVTIICAVSAQRPYRPVAAIPQSPGQIVRILSQTNDVGIDGSYRWSFEAENGIAAQESGQLKNANSQDPIEEAQGSFQYTAPDGTPIQLQYIANEGGFQPSGAHLPVAPPIPPEILKSLEWNAAHPEEDDGNTRPGAGYRG
ncbi:endocuticle structural glycoprotein SgAbd-2 [Dendroctonus ponderosae]